MRADLLRSILVASDLSPDSDGVVRAAASLAGQAGASLHVVHALDAYTHPLKSRVTPIHRLQASMHESRLRLHEQLRRTVAPEVATGSVKIAHESPAAAALRRAEEVEADLIVVGPHRGRLPGSHLLGTTARRVVEAASIPCLVAGEELACPIRRVLVPVGPGDARTRMLAAAGVWVASLRARQERRIRTRSPVELRALHVITGQAAWREFAGEFTEEIDAVSRQHEIAQHLQVRRAVAWNRSPAAEIVRMASSAVADLIVMGVRGSGPFLRALLGGVSAGVLRDAGGPVLLLPPAASDRLAAAFAWDRGGEPDHDRLIAEVDLAARSDERIWLEAYPAHDPADEDDLTSHPTMV